MLLESCCLRGWARAAETREGPIMRATRMPILAVLTALAVVMGACGSQSSGPSPSGGAASAASSAPKANYGGTVTFGLENDVSNLDPMLSGLFVDRNIMYAMYDSLVRVDPKG